MDAEVLQCPGKGVRRRRGVRLSQAIAASGLLLVQLLGTLHFALVQHTLCLEDGEAIHAGSPSSSSVSSRAADAASRDFFGLDRSSAEIQIRDAHQHCLLQSHRRDQLSQPASLRADLRCSLPDGDAVPNQAFQPAQAELFRLAPKQSPPA